MRPSAPITPRVDDERVERVRRTHEEKIIELQNLPAAGLRVLSAVSLQTGVATAVPHGLGRRPSLVILGAIQNASSAGYVNLVSRDAQYINLKATGYGTTITLDIGVL